MQKALGFGKYDKRVNKSQNTRRIVLSDRIPDAYLRAMDTMKGNHALHLAKEISKLPDGCFSISFFAYSKARGEASEKLVVKTHCKARTQLPADRFSVDSENLFLFADKDGSPKACYKILIRYMAFPHDNFKLHKIDWL